MNKIILSLLILSGYMVTQAELEVSMPYCPKVIEAVKFVPESNIKQLEVKLFIWNEVPENGEIINRFLLIHCLYYMHRLG